MSDHRPGEPPPPQSAGLCIKPQAGDVLVAVKLQPRASKNEILGEQGGELRVRVTAAPVDAAANEALVRLLAEVLECPRGRVTMVRGQTARHKVVRVAGISVETARQRLLKG